MAYAGLSPMHDAVIVMHARQVSVEESEIKGSPFGPCPYIMTITKPPLAAGRMLLPGIYYRSTVEGRIS